MNVKEKLINFFKKMKEQITQSREEKFSTYYFQWVKTERAGDVCRFKEFVEAGGLEYIVFTDESRVSSSLIGDVVLIHQYESEIMTEMFPEKAQLIGTSMEAQQNRMMQPSSGQQLYSSNPVLTILEKSKKRTEKITLTLTVKIPSTELYTVIKENFDDVDNVILQSVIDQVQEKTLRESLKRELQNIYSIKKKKI